MVGQQGAAATIGRRTVIGVFADAGAAERALDGLRDAGFAPAQVSVVARDSAAGEAAAVQREVAEAADAPVATGMGAVIGGLGGGGVGGVGRTGGRAGVAAGAPP